MAGVVHLQSRRRRQEGQGLVEFALVLPIFLLVFFGLIDVGVLVFTNSALSQAAREGARVAAAEADWIGVTDVGCVSTPGDIGAGNPGAHVCPPTVASFKDDVVDATNRMAVTLGQITAVHLSCNDGTAGDPAPSGDWTEASGGNGCQDGSGDAISSTGDLVSVRIEYTHRVITPIISSIVGSVPLSGSATMVVN